jgi:flagellar biosynthesis/type III secretory pathway chaperone
MEALQQHQQLCDELHQLALDENSFLQQHRRAPDAALLERKRTLLARLDDTLTALRTASREGVSASNFRQAVEKTRSRILQILQLDRENEQLLLRFSLSGNRLAAATAPVADPSVLQKIYQRHG